MARKRVVTMSQLLDEIQTIVNNQSNNQETMTDKLNSILEQLPDNMRQVTRQKNGSYFILEDDME